jgi:ankyrin repeat protein
VKGSGGNDVISDNHKLAEEIGQIIESNNVPALNDFLESKFNNLSNARNAGANPLIQALSSSNANPEIIGQLLQWDQELCFTEQSADGRTTAISQLATFMKNQIELANAPESTTTRTPQGTITEKYLTDFIQKYSQGRNYQKKLTTLLKELRGLSKNADCIKQLHSQGLKPLLTALNNPYQVNPFIVSWLLHMDQEGCLNERNDHGDSALKQDFCGEYIVELLLSSGFDKHINQSLLFAALKKQNLELCKLLLQHGAHKWINAKNSIGNTPLHIACSSRYYNNDIINLLIKSGANLAIKNNYRLTAFDLLLQQIPLIGLPGGPRQENLFQAVGYFLETKQIDLNRLNDKKQNALHIICQTEKVSGYTNYNSSFVRLFLENGVDPSQMDNQNNLPLHYAIKSAEEETIKLLLNHYGQDINAQQNSTTGATLLHHAANRSHDKKAIIETLFSMKPEIVQSLTLQDNRGNTPLHIFLSNMLRYETLDRIKLLETILTKAEQEEGLLQELLTITNKKGLTILQLAQPQHENLPRTQEILTRFTTSNTAEEQTAAPADLAEVVVVKAEKETAEPAEKADDSPPTKKSRLTRGKIAGGVFAVTIAVLMYYNDPSFRGCFEALNT